LAVGPAGILPADKNSQSGETPDCDTGSPQRIRPVPDKMPVLHSSRPPSKVVGLRSYILRRPNYAFLWLFIGADAVRRVGWASRESTHPVRGMKIKASELSSSALGSFDQIRPFERVSVSQSDKRVTNERT